MVYNNSMNQIVETMVEQINRRPERESLRLFTALGASQMVHGDDFIQFKVKGDRDINKVKVIYDEGQDLYNVEFWDIRIGRKMVMNKKDEIKGLFNDQVTDAIWRRCVIV